MGLPVVLTGVKSSWQSDAGLSLSLPPRMGILYRNQISRPDAALLNAKQPPIDRTRQRMDSV